MNTRPAGDRNRAALGTGLILISGVCWASYVVLSKLGIDLGLNEVEINTARLVISALLIGFFLLVVRRNSFHLPLRTLLLVLVLGAVDYGLGGLLYISSLRYIDASLAFLLVYTFPAMVVLVSILIGRERARPSLFASVIVTFVGVAMVLEVGGAVEGKAWIGVAFVLASAMIFTVYLLVCESFMDRMSSSQISFLTFAGGGMSMLFLLPFVGLRIEILTRPSSLLVLGVLAFVGTALSMILFLMGVRLIGASKASIITTVEPVFAVLLAWLILGEVLSTMQLFGVALQICGMALVQLKTPLAEPGP